MVGRSVTISSVLLRFGQYLCAVALDMSAGAEGEEYDSREEGLRVDKFEDLHCVRGVIEEPGSSSPPPG